MASFGTCADLTLGQNSVFHFEVLRDLTGISGSKCSSFANACGWRNASKLRLLCPVTCNCDSAQDPLWPGIFATSTFGCPSACEEVRAAWTQARWAPQVRSFYRDPPCGDKLDLDITTVPTLADYFRSIFENIAAKPKSVYYDSTMRLLSQFGWVYGAASLEQQQLLAESLLNGASLQSLLAGRWEFAPGMRGVAPPGATRGRSSGCSFLTSAQVTALWQIDLCGAGEFRSIREYCPHSCGCIGNQPECPSFCSNILNVVQSTLVESPSYPAVFKNLSSWR